MARQLHAARRGNHGLGEALAHLRGGPRDGASVLQPLEVAHRDATAVAEDAGEHLDAALQEDAVRVRRHRRAADLRHGARAHLGGHGAGHHLLERRRDQDVALQLPEIVCGHALAVPEPLDGILHVEVVDQVVGVHAAHVHHRAAAVEHAHQARARGAQRNRRAAAHLAEASDREGHLRRVDAHVRQHLAQHLDEPVRAGLLAADDAASLRRLAGGHAMRIGTRRGCPALRIGVGEPRHDLRIGADARAHHVAVGADVLADGPCEPARHALELVARQFARGARHAAVGAAEGQAQQAALERHQRRERAHGLRVHARVEAKPALERPERGVVLHAPAAEEPVLPVVHEHREVHLDLVARLRQDQLLVMLDAHDLRGRQQLLERLVEQVRGVAVDPQVLEHHALVGDGGGRAVGGSAALLAHGGVLSVRNACAVACDVSGRT